jgi:hypothetical protein
VICLSFSPYPSQCTAWAVRTVTVITLLKISKITARPYVRHAVTGNQLTKLFVLGRKNYYFSVNLFFKNKMMEKRI